MLSTQQSGSKGRNQFLPNISANGSNLAVHNKFDFYQDLYTHFIHMNSFGHSLE